MPSIEKISVALPPEMVTQLRQAVDVGEYASASEVVREALRDWSRKRTLQRQGLRDLRRLWRRALDDKTPGVAPGPVLDRLDRKYRSMAAARDNEECA